jgi:hypothetical protein
MQKRLFYLFVVATLGMCSGREATACWPKHRKAWQPPPPCAYTYYYPTVQQPAYTLGQSNLMPLKELPKLPATYFPTQQP